MRPVATVPRTHLKTHGFSEGRMETREVSIVMGRWLTPQRGGCVSNRRPHNYKATVCILYSVRLAKASNLVDLQRHVQYKIFQN